MSIAAASFRGNGCRWWWKGCLVGSIVVTTSTNRSVRKRRTAGPICKFTPPIPTSANATIQDKDSTVNMMIVVPRADKAYLMSYLVTVT